MRQLADKIILITGAYTELGQALLDALVAYHPFCIVSIDSRGETWRGDSSSTPWYDNYYISLGDLEALIALFRLRRPAIVVHLGQDYSNNPIAAFEHNCRGTFNLLMAAESVKETIEAVLLYENDSIARFPCISLLTHASIGGSHELGLGFYAEYKLPVMTLYSSERDHGKAIETILNVLEQGQGGKEYVVRPGSEVIMPVYRSVIPDDKNAIMPSEHSVPLTKREINVQ